MIESGLFSSARNQAKDCMAIEKWSGAFFIFPVFSGVPANAECGGKLVFIFGWGLLISLSQIYSRSAPPRVHFCTKMVCFCTKQQLKAIFDLYISKKVLF